MSELIDNRTQRIRQLKHIIRQLHQGVPAGAVRDQLRAIVRETDYSEMVAMEQELMAEGMPAEEIMSMCDLHSQLAREVLVPPPARSVPPGHPADTMRRENQALREVVARMRDVIASISALADPSALPPLLDQWRQCANELMDADKHYQRKEQLFFSRLEAHGITGPSKVMWGKDDEIRAMLKSLQQALSVREAKLEEWKLVAQTIGRSAAAAIEEMISKEENILLPLCLDVFTEDDWGQIWADSPRYGWCLAAPLEGYRPPEGVLREGLRLEGAQAVQLPTGSLTLEQLLAIFRTLPVDLTFVDADDRVAFFSEGPDRIFARSKAILGRKVQHCHPPRSVDVVDRILEDFRSGRHSVAEFWIQFHGRFVHIRYFAVRNEAGQYLGTLEVTQDITRIRSLEGERRLLQYEESAVQGA
ncbi:MAG: DUF438 domain-containing protein [Bryobacteraceae bacterium]|nr:DUF438 domain-containing protein [Bryobacteraceae bacterium]